MARVGVEGTGSYGAGLARYLRTAGIEVVEVDRPSRQARRRAGESDPLDAIEAARAALSGRAAGAAKTRDGNVEAIRVLVVARRSARSTKIKTLNQIRHLSYTAPDQLRERLKGVSRQQLAARAAALRPSQREGADPVLVATKTALRILGRRVLALDEEKARIGALLSELVTQTAPELLTLHGVGIDTAATLLVTAGDNPGRLRSEAAWAAICPGNYMSARKSKGGRTGDGGAYIKPLLIQAAWAAVRVPGRLQARFGRLVRKFGGPRNKGAQKRAITAIAHTLLKIAHGVLKTGQPYAAWAPTSTPAANPPMPGRTT